MHILLVEDDRDLAVNRAPMEPVAAREPEILSNHLMEGSALPWT